MTKLWITSDDSFDEVSSHLAIITNSFLSSECTNETNMKYFASLLERATYLTDYLYKAKFELRTVEEAENKAYCELVDSTCSLEENF